VAGSFGDAAGVRQLGQALQAAGRGVNSVAGDLSGQVKSLVPGGWSGNGAGAFSSDWTAKAAQSAQLAAVCNHVGQVLIGLAGELDAANQKASSAQQVTGGPASRFALPSTEQKSQQLLSQASGAAQQAQAAARAKLAGIAVPKIGPPLTVSQVTAWAGRLAPPPQPWYDTVLHDIGSFFGNLFSGGPSRPPPKPPLANAHSFVQVSPHVWVPANDPKLPELKAAWAWASKRPVYLSGSPGETEFTRWVDAFTVSPYASDLNKGGLGREFGSFQPDYRVGGAFNQNQNVILTTAGMGAAVFFADPRSLVGASPEAVRKLIPDSWTGPRPLRTGRPGWRYYDGKGRSVMYEEGDPNAPDLGKPDSILHRGPYFRITEDGYEYRIAAPGNPAFNDSNAATISVTAPDGTKTYINETMPEDMPGDELGGGGAEGEGGDGGGGGAAGE
jgi:hypothetical protein